MKRQLLMILALFVVLCACKKENKKALATISTSAATSITASSAVVGGSILNTGGSSITQSGICYAMNNNPTLSDSIKTGGGVTTGAFNVTISNLNANSSYYYRAYAINSTGTALGVVDSFKTSPGVPTLTTTEISNNKALTATSGGVIVNNGGATITAQGVCWATTANPTTANFKTTDTSTGNSFASAIGGLSLNVTYYVRSYATNSYGTGYGNQISFTVSSSGTVTDIDGITYGTITIGTQTWTTSNLRVRHYRNGDPIVDGFTGFNLDTTFATGAYTFPNGDTTLTSAYGLYYNYGAVTDPRNIAPVGWHVPTDNDWYTLEFYEGMTAADTSKTSNDFGLRGTIGGKMLVGGSSGLNLQLAGYYLPHSGYVKFNVYGVYLSSSAPAGVEANYFRGFNVSGPGPIYRAYSQYIASVRLVKD